MKYSKKDELTGKHKTVFEQILASMTTQGRYKAVIKYGGDDSKSLKGKWEGYHILAFYNSKRPDTEKNEINDLDSLLDGNGLKREYFENIPSNKESSYTTIKSKIIFNTLAEYQDISLLECFLQFLKFCRDASPTLPLSVFDDPKTRPFDSLDGCIKDIQKYIDEWEENQSQDEESAQPQGEKPVVPTTSQPYLTLPPDNTENVNFYGSRTINVVGRDEEQEFLKKFINDKSKNFYWLQIAGIAGQGKSRLALELIIYARTKGWLAGFLEGDDELNRMKDMWLEWQPLKPTLIVIDYVVSRTILIVPILKHLCRNDRVFDSKVRLLLVERMPWNRGVSTSVSNSTPESMFSNLDRIESKSEWFLDLCDRYDGNDKDIHTARYKEGVVELTNLEPKNIAAIVRECGKVSEKIPDEEIFNIFNKAGLEHTPLYATLVAQTISNLIYSTNWEKEEILGLYLDREREKWWSASFNGHMPRLSEQCHENETLVVSTILEGINIAELENLKTGRTIFKPLNKPLVKLNHKFLNEIGSRVSRGIKPDIFGQYFVLNYLSKNPTRIKDIITFVFQLSPEKSSRFIQRLANDFLDLNTYYEILNCLPIKSMDTQLSFSLIRSILIAAYLNNQLVTPHISSAIKYICRKGSAQALCDIGYCYMKGIGVREDQKKAFNLYQKASKTDHPIALRYLAECYQYGFGVDKDADATLYYYKEAINSGDSVSAVKVGDIFLKENTQKPYFVKLYEMAAHAGNSEGAEKLIKCFLDGLGVKKDYLKSNLIKDWFEKEFPYKKTDTEILNKVINIKKDRENNQSNEGQYRQQDILKVELDNDQLYFFSTYYNHNQTDEKHFSWADMQISKLNIDSEKESNTSHYVKPSKASAKNILSSFYYVIDDLEYFNLDDFNALYCKELYYTRPDFYKGSLIVHIKFFDDKENDVKTIICLYGRRGIIPLIEGYNVLPKYNKFELKLTLKNHISYLKFYFDVSCDYILINSFNDLLLLNVPEFEILEDINPISDVGGSFKINGWRRAELFCIYKSSLCKLRVKVMSDGSVHHTDCTVLVENMMPSMKKYDGIFRLE